MALAFQGACRALSADAIASAANSLCAAAPEIWTVLNVETRGCGYLADRRPAILFERHIFSHLTNGRFDICDVSNPFPGGYGADGAHQYDRLAAALALDRTAALQSASWGMAQVMGENFACGGFSDVESMVSAMCDSEDAQLACFVGFLKMNRLDGFLRSHDWCSLARGYNGSTFAQNQYDQKLAAQFAKFSAGPLPDLDLRAAQLYLAFLGFNPGPVDGVPGNRTKNALIAYQQQRGLPQTGVADPETLNSLRSSLMAA